MNKFFSLKKKLLYWVIFCICIPISLFFVIFTHYESDVFDQELERYAEKQVSLLSEQLDWILRSVQYVSKNYYNSSLVNEIVSPTHSRDKQQFFEDQFALLAMQKMNNYILEDMRLQVTVITRSGDIYGTELYRKSFDIEKMKDTTWYQQLQKNPWDILWIKDSVLSNLNYDDGQEKIFNIWVLKDPKSYQPTGLLIVDFSSTELDEQFEGYFDEHEIFIVKDMYQNEIAINSAKQHEPQIDLPLQAAPVRDTSMDLSEYYAATTETVHGKWAITLYTTKGIVQNQYGLFPRLFYIALFVYSILLVLLLWFISNQLVRPIQSLTRTMQIAQSGNIKARTEVKSNDEIGQLADTYNGLLDRIGTLMEDVILESEQKRKAEMQALFAQINPHFIINTLTSIRSLIFFGDNSAAEKAMRTFAFLLKKTLSREDEMCTLGEEIEYIFKYIEILQMSFEKPIQVYMKIDPTLNDCLIIKMITQPIIENAILHGLKAKEGDKALRIEVSSNNGVLQICISDNGVGCDKKLEFNEVKMEFDHNIGMQNVYNRIVLHYGAKYGLSFESTPGVGTVVTLHLQVIRSEGYHDSQNTGC